MIEIAKDTELDRKINQLINMAWGFGFDCANDDIRSIDEQGDSHIEFLRSKLNIAKDELYQMMLPNV